MLEVGITSWKSFEELGIKSVDDFATKRGTGAFLEGAEGGTGLGKPYELNIKVTQEGLDRAKSHLSQFGEYPQNTMMIDRLENAMKTGQKITGGDANFYLHELSESKFMSKGNSLVPILPSAAQWCKLR